MARTEVGVSLRPDVDDTEAAGVDAVRRAVIPSRETIDVRGGALRVG